jgi:hypothetical protein
MLRAGLESNLGSVIEAVHVGTGLRPVNSGAPPTRQKAKVTPEDLAIYSTRLPGRNINYSEKVRFGEILVTLIREKRNVHSWTTHLAHSPRVGSVQFSLFDNIILP